MHQISQYLHWMWVILTCPGRNSFLSRFSFLVSPTTPQADRILGASRSVCEEHTALLMGESQDTAKPSPGTAGQMGRPSHKEQQCSRLKQELRQLFACLQEPKGPEDTSGCTQPQGAHPCLPRPVAIHTTVSLALCHLPCEALPAWVSGCSKLFFQESCFWSCREGVSASQGRP